MNAWLKPLLLLDKLAKLRRRPKPDPKLPERMSPGTQALTLVKTWEGCRLDAYLCPAGVWTIGYGHTGPLVVSGLRWTQAAADAALVDDLEDVADTLRRHVKVPLTQNQFDALTSLVYNIGPRAFRQSTLLQLLNAGNYMGASAEFGKWRLAKGKVLKGLVDRRKAEREVFDAV